MFLNLNIPENWNGTFQTVPLGARWYHNATDMIDQKSTGVAFEVGAARIVDEEIEMTDCHAIGFWERLDYPFGKLAPESPARSPAIHNASFYRDGCRWDAFMDLGLIKEMMDYGYAGMPLQPLSSQRERI